jgi:hypothetical protein
VIISKFTCTYITARVVTSVTSGVMTMLKHGITKAYSITQGSPVAQMRMLSLATLHRNRCDVTLYHQSSTVL